MPRNHGTNTTLVGGLTTSEIEVAMTLDGADNTPAFGLFREHFLCRALRPGQTVIIDNLGVHKGARIRAMVEAAGCRLLFLPAYSPDFAPIEQTLVKIKALLRRAEARTKEALEAAIAIAIDAVTSDDARTFFRHCG